MKTEKSNLLVLRLYVIKKLSRHIWDRVNALPKFTQAGLNTANQLKQVDKDLPTMKTNELIKTWNNLKRA